MISDVVYNILKRRWRERIVNGLSRRAVNEQKIKKINKTRYIKVYESTIKQRIYGWKKKIKNYIYITTVMIKTENRFKKT